MGSRKPHCCADQQQAMLWHKQPQALLLRRQPQAILLRRQQQAMLLRYQPQAMLLRSQLRAMLLRRQPQAMLLRRQPQALLGCPGRLPVLAGGGTRPPGCPHRGAGPTQVGPVPIRLIAFLPKSI